jgi:hypothetical protein
MRRGLIGLLILGIVAAIAVVLSQLDLGGLTRAVERREPVAVSILYGGEKSALLGNPRVREIIERRYRITLTATRVGSVELVTTRDATGRDCLWPSNAIALELARATGKTVLSDANIFNSPIVFFAWEPVAAALVAKGVAVQRPDGTLTADIAAIAALIESGARWKEDLGLNIYGPFRIFSTSPARSNSGNIWAGLLAIVFNGGTPPNEAQLATVLPRLTAYFETMGYMEASSGDIFENFLKQGMGARPVIVGYENQLVEFLIANAGYADLIKSRIRVIYPEPTVFASHPLISLTPACARLAEALQDPDLQALAWSEHGFRTGLIEVENDPAAITVTTLPATVDLVVPMPSARVMERVIAAIP